jgi:hypothetical protein
LRERGVPIAPPFHRVVWQIERKAWKGPLALADNLTGNVNPAFTVRTR